MNPVKTLAKKLALAAVVVGGMFAAQAHAVTVLTVGDSYYVGRIADGIPPSAQNELDWLNALIDLAPGAGITTCLTENCDRIGSTVALPATNIAATGVKDESSDYTDLALNGAMYILGKYGAGQEQNQVIYVWYVGGLDGTVTLPGTSASGGGLSHYTLFGSRTTTVPEPATLGLLGLGLLGVGLARRRRKVA